MKENEILPAIKAGKFLMVVEYRGGVAEKIDYRDKVTGRSASFLHCVHTVEAGPLSIRVSERVPEGFDATKFVPPFKKGTACIVHLEALNRAKGVYSASGTLEALQAA